MSLKKILPWSLLFCVLLSVGFLSAQTGTKSTIFKPKCVGCGDCVRACPVKAIAMDHGKAVIDPKKCVGCRICVLTCSYGAPR